MTTFSHVLHGPSGNNDIFVRDSYTVVGLVLAFSPWNEGMDQVTICNNFYLIYYLIKVKKSIQVKSNGVQNMLETSSSSNVVNGRVYIRTFQFLHLKFPAGRYCNADLSPTSTEVVCLVEAENDPRTCVSKKHNR